MSDQRAEEKAALHGHPSAIEIIAADFPDWEVSRDRAGPCHGLWRAVRGDTELTAPSPRELLELLEARQ